jgi:hypothetical protein
MLTVTVRHHQGAPLEKVARGLERAWRRTRQGGRIQRLWSSHVKASVKAKEVTFGDSGWHPHLHVLLATGEWDEDDRDALLVRFRECVRKELGSDFLPTLTHALKWSRSFEAESADAAWLASYVSKFACEVSGIEKEAVGGETPWDIAGRALAGDASAVRLWQEYEMAMRGRRAVELDDRAAAAAKVELEKEKERNDEAREGDEGAVPERQDIVVTRDELRALRRAEPRSRSIMRDVLRAAELGGAPAVRDVVALVQQWHLWHASEHGGQESEDAQGKARSSAGSPREACGLQAP